MDMFDTPHLQTADTLYLDNIQVVKMPALTQVTEITLFSCYELDVSSLASVGSVNAPTLEHPNFPALKTAGSLSCMQTKSLGIPQLAQVGTIEAWGLTKFNAPLLQNFSGKIKLEQASTIDMPLCV
ncbi:MAG: hypothetical protein H6765_11360 [Candidatus Peribacteria bacterium]|nr:MAG: hypothetical protein H6765_11360 [Candidatus Peribacteria bacterium]